MNLACNVCSFLSDFISVRSLMQKGHELLIPTAHAHLEFLALMKIILFTKKGNSTIVFSFYFITFVLRYDKGWMIYCQNINCQRKERTRRRSIRRRMRRRSRQRMHHQNLIDCVITNEKKNLPSIM